MISGVEKEKLRDFLKESGAIEAGFAKAEEISASADSEYQKWLSKGFNAGMEWMIRHSELRRHPDKILSEVRTVISLAFSFVPTVWRDNSLPMIACYAYGDDYHDVIKARLIPLVNRLKDNYGGNWRICTDSAPLAERYWAVKSGIGKRGLNGAVMVGKSGGMCFLAEVVTTVEIEPDKIKDKYLWECIGCRKCIEACPTGALHSDGTIDSRRCLSYLTIEHKGDWENETLEIIKEAEENGILFGCDRCITSCPHINANNEALLTEFKAREEILHLDQKEVMSLSEEEFSRIFKRSPLKRIKLSGLRRNANTIKNTLIIRN